MLCPKLAVKASSFRHPLSQPKQLVDHHPFNNALEILLPSVTKEPIQMQARRKDFSAALASVETGATFYYVVRAPIAALVEPGFVAQYIQTTGDFLAISCGTCIDRTDVTAISSDGKLHMAVSKDTYEQLGLQGKASSLTPGKRYNICIDMRAKSFVPGRKLHDRVQLCLQRAAAMDMLCTYVVDGVCHPISFPLSSRWCKVPVTRSHVLLSPFPLPPLGEISTPQAPSSLHSPLATHANAGPHCTASAGGSQSLVEQPFQDNARSYMHGGKGLAAMKGLVPLSRALSDGGMEVDSHRDAGEAADLSTANALQRDVWDAATCPLDPEFLSALFEWIGAASCRLHACQDGGADGQEYSWAAPWQGEAVLGEVHAVRLKGLISPSEVQTATVMMWCGTMHGLHALLPPGRLTLDTTCKWVLLQVLSCLEYVRSLVRAKQVTWAVVTVWGFADAPVSWNGAEHGYLRGGENDYSIVVLPDERFLLFRAAGTEDAMQ